MMEQTTKKRRGIGVLDVLMILAAVAVLVLGLKWADSQSGVAAAETTANNVTFSVEVKEVPEDFGNGIEPGVKVYDSAKGGLLGELVSIEVTPYRSLAYDIESQSFFERDVPGAYNAIITVSGAANLTDRNTTIGNVTIAVGEEMFLKSKDFAGQGYCIVAERKEAA